MACFSCSENKNENQISILSMYKDVYDMTGKAFWFFSEVGSNDIKIMANEDFKIFKKQNASDFRKKKYEFSHISEFRVLTDN